MRIGPSFGAELTAAGCAEGVSWTAEGQITYGQEDMMLGDDDVPIVKPATKAAVEAVLAAHDPDKPAPEPVPDSASRLGLMRALREASKWDTAKAAIASNAEAQEEWDLAISIKRDDPLTAGIIQALGLTSADVDQLLVRAAALTS